jgi:radical SAM protein
MNELKYQYSDFAHSPLMFYYEVTQACDLVCKHCRASAQPSSHPEELSHEQSRALIDQLATFPRPPVLVMTGGDPLKRPDLFELIRYAKSIGVQVALTPSATPLATKEKLKEARDAGVARLGISLDSCDAATHDSFRGWEGSFDRTMTMMDNALDLGMGVQVNTTVTRRNIDQLDAMADLLAPRGIAMWSVFFLVPVGRGWEEQRITPEEYEQVFERLWHHAQHQPYAIKTTEAPHYRRYVLQQQGNPQLKPQDPSSPSVGHRAPLGAGDGKGIMFVSHKGEIYPAGFLPLLCGRFPENSVVDVYQKNQTFLDLRDADKFKGKCGICEFRHICGGSRSRAFADTGDPLASEPDCVYQPEGS